tara:strand:- start:351 stop:824 length:474 start_codon:yes stop_codon:yes gene_type:complete
MKDEKNMRKKIIHIFIYVIVGIIMGGYLFSNSQPRSFLALHRCDNTCLKPQELMGLVNAVVMQKNPNLMPKVVIETEKSIAITHPFPESPIHYVVFPKRDIKNIGELANGDEEYFIDIMSVLSQLIRENNVTEYQIISNGPDYQHTTYLHFHLRAKK